MIHTLEAFNQDTGHRVKRGDFVPTGDGVAWQLVTIDNPEQVQLLHPRTGLTATLPPHEAGLYVRDMTKPDYSNVRKGLEAIELLQDAIAQLSLTTEVSALITGEPAGGGF